MISPFRFGDKRRFKPHDKFSHITDQYWQAGILSHKTDFEMNVHGPYYGELLVADVSVNELFRNGVDHAGWQDSQCSTYGLSRWSLWRI